MIMIRSKLIDKKQTANKIKYLVNCYYNDIDSIRIRQNGKMKELSKLPLKTFFNFVKNIKYRMDNSPIEIISRPKHILNQRNIGMDCKKKSILIASYLKKNRIPYRFICSSTKPNRRIHHIFPQAYLNGTWKNVDATYSKYKLFSKKPVTKAEYL